MALTNVGFKVVDSNSSKTKGVTDVVLPTPTDAEFDDFIRRLRIATERANGHLDILITAINTPITL